MPFILVFILHTSQYLNGILFDATIVIPNYYEKGLFLYTNLLSFIYPPVLIFFILRFLKKIEDNNGLQKVKDQVNWFKSIIRIGALVCGLGTICTIIILVLEQESSLIAYPFFICISLWIYWISYISLNKSIYSKKVGLYTSEKLSKTGFKTFDKIDKGIKEQKLYLDDDLTLNKIAEKFKISGGYLSQLINQHTEKNFNEYINTCRIEVAKEMLKDGSYNNYTIDAISLECGFKSKSNFYTTFKKHTSMTPSQFKKLKI